MSFAIPVGQVSQAKRGGETPYLLDLRGNIPTVIIITHGLIHEVNILEQLTFEAGAFYLMDRAYLDFPRLH